ncbi:hypothetical protein [Sporosarcina cyprini]|uniref:hypothetical protein n=1 Tax=Sporosarcina cyprini TaxID=2910523 RepID=UPI001EDEA155|nr:hypothetical protein [Sporosarcina cyprini]MCG3089159.1 hypothetical protein [Sporosarcina cyprini]
MEHIINQLILTAGAWNETGQSDKYLEKQFEGYLNALQRVAGTDQEGAMQLLLKELGEDEQAA